MTYNTTNVTTITNTTSVISAALILPVPPVFLTVFAAVGVLLSVNKASLTTIELVSLLSVLVGKVELPPVSLSLFGSTTAVVAPGASDIRVPDTVIAGPPGTSVWPATRNWESEFAVKVSPPIVRTIAVG